MSGGAGAALVRRRSTGSRVRAVSRSAGAAADLDFVSDQGANAVQISSQLVRVSGVIGQHKVPADRGTGKATGQAVARRSTCGRAILHSARSLLVGRSGRGLAGCLGRRSVGVRRGLRRFSGAGC